MTTITITAEQIANKVMEHYSLVEQGFIKQQEHVNYCQTLIEFFGSDIYKEACGIMHQSCDNQQ